MEIPVYTVDAFTNLPFKGNPAAVCLLENELKEELYQKIAAEMNLSETAFITNLKPTEDFCSGARFGLRWFTPTHEVNLCGHATLASAAVLFYKKKNPNSVVAFETLSGELLVHQRGESLVMVFPLNKPEVQDRKNFTDILKAAVGDLPIQEVCYCKTTKELLVCLLDTCDRSMLTSLRPMTESLLKSEDSGRIKSLTITVKGAPTSQLGYDFYSRNFAPWVGIPEDPVTGSAHTVLAAYWSEKLGKKKMLAYQCSKRGGELELELRGDNRVDIAGRAVVLLQGILKL
ncbi:phenazine biosynthesis-like domain-containing protein 1 isoform X5 [Neoarius graeffei]|uniref:phenazine biosynthesis-like domain-containing protein 1 isoform X5 n=1 Tax=Neoarius graeffei TaxID=443677 RepID=UPI00298CC560|nr:phenazine biosynthesis-like domain-containing protein 1 isoform X5 [Neoarius graeffei]